MKLQLTICDNPIDIRYPIEAYEIGTKGQKRGPFYYSIEDLIGAFNQFKQEDEYVEIPLLPEQTAHVTHTRNMNNFRLILDFQKSIQLIRYESMKIQREDFLGIPRCVLSLNVMKVENGWKVKSTRIFAVEEDVKLLPNTQLSHFPYPNVYKEGIPGSICWGFNNLPTFKDLRELSSIYQLFLSAPFNEHLGTRIFSKEKFHTFQEYLELLDKYDEPQDFKDEELIPCGLTFADLLKLN